MQSRDDEIESLTENDLEKEWGNFCFRCCNTEDFACEHCEYKGSGEPTEYQNIEESFDFLEAN